MENTKSDKKFSFAVPEALLQLERDIRESSGDGDELLSGSGENPLTPSPPVPTSTPSAIPPYTPSSYIKLTLVTSPENYLRDQQYIESGVVSVLESFLSTNAVRKRTTEGMYSVVVQFDMETSSETLSVVKAYVNNDATGEQSIEETENLYTALSSNTTAVYRQIKDAIDIVSP